jgi:hypothetical protein
VRSLSPAEGRVIHALIAEVDGGERERLRVAEVPRSTFHKIRGKAYREGWIRERFVPDPVFAGTRSVRVALGEPFADRWEEAVGWWRQRRGTVLLWTGLGAVLSVVFDEAAPDPERPVLGPPEWFRRCCEVRAEATGTGVPIYFDHEGAWSRWIGAGALVSYPIGLGARAGASPPAGPKGLSGPRLAALRALLAPPRDPSSGETLDAPGSAARREEVVRFTQAGWIRHRAFPDLRRIPPRDGARLTQVVLVTGTWKAAPRPAELLMRVRADAGAVPFLYAHDLQRTILGLHGPRVQTASPPTVGLGGALGEYLGEIEVVREPIDSLSFVVDHDYSRILPDPAPAAAPEPAEALTLEGSRPPV